MPGSRDAGEPGSQDAGADGTEATTARQEKTLLSFLLAFLVLLYQDLLLKRKKKPNPKFQQGRFCVLEDNAGRL